MTAPKERTTGLAIEVELLTGRYVATSYNDRDTPEWPPHPARFFSALVATWADGGQSGEEAAALEWLESQEPPRLIATDAWPRTAVTTYVPVNDVQTVSEPERERKALHDALRALEEAQGEADAKAVRTAEKQVERARARLVEQTARRIAADDRTRAEDLKRARGVLPEGRIRQARTFPSVNPGEPRFVLKWADSPSESKRQALASLCSRLVRVGHSSSLVRARLIEPVAAKNNDTLVPDPAGNVILRVPGPGQLERLTQAFAQHKEVEPRVLPARFVRYRREGEAPIRKQPARSHFSSHWTVYARVAGTRFPSLRTADLARAFRGALLRHASEPIPPYLSGHEADGSPTEVPHVAFVPLPFVGSTYADGQILGVAVIQPREATPEQEILLARALGRWEESVRLNASNADLERPPLKLWLGKGGELTLERIEFGRADKVTLRESTWCRPSDRWATATPIALDRNPGDLHDSNPERRKRAFANAEESVRRACEHIGLPSPVEVDVVRSAVLPGTEKPIRFPPFPRESGKTRRVLVHARLLFEEPVAGPVLLGAGRYFGLGLCRPVDKDNAS